MNKIKEFRAEAGMSQRELADLSGCSQVYISQLEAGSRTDPGVRRARGIVRALRSKGLDCGLDDVFPPDREQGAEAA